MEYPQLKELITTQAKEYMGRGASEEEAGMKVLQAFLAMYREEKIGVVDLKLAVQILGFDFTGDLAKEMDEAKKAFREYYGFDDAIAYFKNQGLTDVEAAQALIESLYDMFKKGDIKGPELFDGALWSLGYRVKEQFYLTYYKGKKPKLEYEVDD